jgi:hypothetical protein
MNNEILNNCNLLIDFINSLEEEFVGLYSGLSEIPEINEHELPLDFQYFIKWSNGFSLFGTEILGIGNIQYDLLKTTHWEQNESNNLIPIFLIPFSPVGNGDYYCFDLKDGLNEKGLCPIIYWQWNYSTKDNYEVVNESFVDWLKELIDDSLADEEE